MSWSPGPLSLPRAAARSVQVTLHNRPRNLAESRLILRTLQKFGEVVTYRHLKAKTQHQPGVTTIQTQQPPPAAPQPSRSKSNDTANANTPDENNSSSSSKDVASNPKNTVVAIFDTPDAASRAVAASPIRIPLLEKMIAPNPTADQYRRGPDPWAYFEAKAKAKRLKYMKIYIEPWAVAPKPVGGDSALVMPMAETAPEEEQEEEEEEEDDIEDVSRVRNSHGHENRRGHGHAHRHGLEFEFQFQFDHERDMLRNPYHGPYLIDQDTYQFQDLWRNSDIPLRELGDGMIARKEHLPRQRRIRVERENEKLGAASLMKMYREGFEKEKIERERERERMDQDHELEPQQQQDIARGTGGQWQQQHRAELHEQSDDLHDHNWQTHIDGQDPTNRHGNGRGS